MRTDNLAMALAVIRLQQLAAKAEALTRSPVDSPERKDAVRVVGIDAERAARDLQASLRMD